MGDDEAARMDEEYVHCHRCGEDFRGEDGECPRCEKALADPRGPLHTVTEATFTPSGYQVRFAECSHIAVKNATMTVRPGDRARCFHCGPNGAR